MLLNEMSQSDWLAEEDLWIAQPVHPTWHLYMPFVLKHHTDQGKHLFSLYSLTFADESYLWGLSLPKLQVQFARPQFSETALWERQILNFVRNYVYWLCFCMFSSNKIQEYYSQPIWLETTVKHQCMTLVMSLDPYSCIAVLAETSLLYLLGFALVPLLILTAAELSDCRASNHYGMTRALWCCLLFRLFLFTHLMYLRRPAGAVSRPVCSELLS